MARPMTTANSLKTRPMTPPMKKTGMNTATNDRVIDMMVKVITREPLRAASIGLRPASLWRTMFSTMTTASSTTKPTARVSAMSDTLSRLKPARYIAANVPMMETGKASAGMIVADNRRTNRKMTSTTRITVRINVCCISVIEA